MVAFVRRWLAREAREVRRVLAASCFIPLAVSVLLMNHIKATGLAG